MLQIQYYSAVVSLTCDTSLLLDGGAVYRAVGVYSPPRGEKRYAIATCDGISLWRAGDMGGVSLLLDLYPDYDHWRAIYPKGKNKIDGTRARAAIMRECVEAGPWVPPEGLAFPGRSNGRGAGKEKGGDVLPPLK